MINRRNLLMIGCATLATAWTTGCGGNSRERYLPSATVAKDTLVKVLDAWKTGAPYQSITTSKPAINIFESRWRDGKKLESYEILEEVKNADQPQFKVRLQIAGQPEETTTYLVIGIDPLNVFRDVDYKQTESM